MKWTNRGALLRALTVLAALLLAVGGCEKSFELYAQNGIAKIDTVDTVVQFQYKAKYTGCVSALGATLFYNPGRIAYLADSTEVYGVFHHEVINLVEPGRLQVSFNTDSTQGEPACGLNGQPIFKMAFRVNAESEQGPCDVRLENVRVQLYGEDLRKKASDYEFFISWLFEFWPDALN